MANKKDVVVAESPAKAKRLKKYVVVVESPAKAKTLKKYLGKEYEVLASYGHVRDLIPKEGAVDTENGFAMKYEIIEKNQKHVDAIAKAVNHADALFLATDLDREGEAISWHLLELLKQLSANVNDIPVHRVVFHQITKNAILDAMKHPREIALPLVNAQQARRALDYLVGFNLSPLLWKKIRRGLSAGRVQSPALRLIVERELDIEKFIAQEYWSIDAKFEAKAQGFPGKLIEYNGEKLQQFSITNEKQATEIHDRLQKAANGQVKVARLEKKQRKRNPSTPFITSTLQQEAARKLGFTTQRTMRIAQQLYEGIDIGGETVGLITYMRTDSVHLADEALTEIRELITQRYGKDYLPEDVRHFKTSAKNAQEAHEAIRPTSAHRIPDELENHLSQEQFKLYDLIWKRSIACQMSHAVLNVVTIDFTCGIKDTLRTTGSTIVHPGFLSVYEEGIDDNKKEEESGLLPALKEGDMVDLKDLASNQHFTEPPPRFSEASLVKALEEHGIGRPSTYASIISTLQQREYVELNKKRFTPTDVGRVVARFLTEHFTDYVDYTFTAKLEDELDEVSRDEKEWVPLLQHFWTPFSAQVEKIGVTVKRSDVTQEALDEACPKCGKPLATRLGRRGRFVGCTAYPECDYTRNVEKTGEEEDEASTQPELVEGRLCPDCNSPLQIRHGRYGKFIGCSAYPKCKHIEPLQKPEDSQISCPECHEGTMLKRRSKRGKFFYSCARYPTCKYAIWDPPVAEACPQCAWPILTIKTTKSRGTEKICPRKECGYKISIESDPEDAKAATNE